MMCEWDLIYKALLNWFWDNKNLISKLEGTARVFKGVHGGNGIRGRNAEGRMLLEF